MWFHYGSHGSKIFPDIIVLERFHRPNVFDSCLCYGKGKKTLPSLWKGAIIDSRPHHVYSHINYNWIPYLMLLNNSCSVHNFSCNFYKTYLTNQNLIIINYQVQLYRFSTWYLSVAFDVVRSGDLWLEMVQPQPIYY